ncbi:peroxiredoxin family protein [Neobacillus sp. D3-1R]|uniref:peroxiredoxin family protein n=1 Tax=Neobacillus sp. D3-1R TaxID=3445778 RepID=UPI003FA067EB
MVKKVIAAVVLIVLFTVAIVQAMDRPESSVTNKTGTEIKDKAPDFELKTLDGKTVKLSELRGKKVILNFWATWCPPCKAEMPEMQKFHEEVGDEVIILAVNIDPQLDVQKFVDDMGITFTIPLDDEDLVNADYQVVSIPTTYFIDTKGVIQGKHVGAMTYDNMKNYTSKLK